MVWISPAAESYRYLRGLMFPAICWAVFSIATELNNPVIKTDHNTVDSLSAYRLVRV